MAAVVLLKMLTRRNTSIGMSELTLRFVFGKVEGNFREESATVVFALRHSQRKRLEMVEGGGGREDDGEHKQTGVGLFQNKNPGHL